MSNIMNNDKIKAMAAELAKDLKTPEDLSALSAQLKKIAVEAALNAEMEDHLGYHSMRLKAAITGTTVMVIPRRP